MYKLTVIHGAMKGQVFKLEDGERSIGRAPGNDIVINSTQISKRHCTLMIVNDTVEVRDAGSSNGTFVNGILVKTKKLVSGDRLSIGDAILEVTKLADTVSNVIPLRGAPVGGFGSVGGIPGGTGSFTVGGGTSGAGLGIQGGAPAEAVPEAPTNLKDKVRFWFEKTVINFLFNLNEKQEWRSIVAGIFGIVAVGGAFLAVYPVLNRTTDKLELEAKERAFLVARQMMERNTQALYEKMESKVDVSSAEKEKGVLAAYIVDMEGRVLAPARKYNQYLTEPNEAAFSAIVRSKFNESETREQFWKVYGDSVFVSVPLRVFNPSAGKNVSSALAIVAYDRTLLLFDSGTMALAYIQAMILSAILSVIGFFSLYKLTLKPLETLNEEMDQSLKNGGGGISLKYQMEEISPLVNAVNTALSRAAGTASTLGGSGGGENLSSDDALSALKFLADQAESTGMMIVSPGKQVLHLNAQMEELSGIRAQMAAGAEFASVARDQAFIAFVDDVVARVTSGGTVSEEFEFSGTQYKMECSAAGAPGAAKFILVTAKKAA